MIYKIEPWKNLKDPFKDNLSTAFLCGLVDSATSAVNYVLTEGRDPSVSISLKFEEFKKLNISEEFYVRITCERVSRINNYGCDYFNKDMELCGMGTHVTMFVNQRININENQKL